MTKVTKDLLLRLLASALIEIREEGYEMQNKRVFALADLFHNVPGQLERMERGEKTPDEIMQWLQERARYRGIERWLEHRVDAEAKYRPGQAD